VKRRLAVLLALPLAACAAHNHHRIPIDLNADLAPLIDEAWANMEKSGLSAPLGATPVVVQVEDVDVEWLPFSPEVPPGGSTMPEAEMKKAIEDVLRPPVEPPLANPQRHVRVALAVDLNDPDALQIQVECALVDPIAEGVLARGWSTIVRFERLYCHGCREQWGGHGTQLAQLYPGTYDPYCASGGIFFTSYGCSSPGYIKN
jgi:hypothetical protein